MATNQVTVKLTDLTVLQQETLNKYFPVVEKLFLAESTSNTTSFTTADQEFRSGIVNFLDAIEKIFGDNSLNPTTLQNTSEDNFVVESCLESCRLIYRKEFHEFLYLTAVKLKSLHAEARDEAVVKLQECSLRFNLCENKLAGLKDELLSELKLERIWIDEVNNFKKNSVLSEIKAIVLENLNKLIIEELPNLVGEAQVEFYDTFEFRQKVMKLMNFALKSFKEQIPYKEDKISQAKMCKEFDDQVVKIVRDLRNKIRLSPGKLMASEVDSSVTKYSNAIGSMLENDPMAEALDIRIQHETLQELHMPIFKISSPTLDNLRSDYLQNYFDETEQVFQKQICEHSQNTIEFLNQSYQELFEVFDKFVGKEVTNIFEKRKIPMAHIQRIRQTFNEQLKIVVEEIKDSTIANPEVVENVTSWGKPTSSIKGVETKNKNYTANNSVSRKLGPVTHVNIQLLTGKTYKLDAFNLWTVKILRKLFMDCMGTEYKTCSLYYRCKKLQDEYTLRSYNIRDGDIIFANI